MGEIFLKSNFYALLSRMKYINRWGLMHNSRTETLSEHTLDTAFITHALVAIHNKHFGGNLSEGDAVLYAMYHDCSEILTGDLPTPVKYYNHSIHDVYKDVEHTANKKLLSMVPNEIKESYNPYLICQSTSPYTPFVKAADKLSALIKCIEEKKLGNPEFDKAYLSTLKAIKSLNIAEADIFLKEFIPSYKLTLDDLKLDEE